MPSLEIAVAQPGFQNHLCTLRAQTPLHSKVISSPFTFGIDKKLSSWCKSSDIPKKSYFNWGNIKTPRSRLVIQAVATFEAKSVVHNENGHLGYTSSELNKDASPFQRESSSDDSSEMDEKEKLRRLRISKANKGNTPWNKGRKHSPETLQLIKERTRLAMQDPKVKMKLVNLGHAQTWGGDKNKNWDWSPDGVGKTAAKLSLQENCCYEWQNLIAEASRRGYDGEEELQWDSYKILDGKLKEEYLESIEQRKIMRRPKGSKRAPKSLEQRRKISQAISAKWNDPEYRDRVCSALSKYYDASYGNERKPRKRSPRNTESPRRSPTKKKVFEEKKISKNEIKLQKLKLRRSKGPMYKDPLASSKMEMIKNIRAQRAATETKKTEAIERARLLIAEAEKAAMALEASATKSPVARASLIETRQLIAEAIRSIESIDTMQISSHENEEPSVASNEVISQSEKENWFWGLTDADDAKVNGTLTFSSHGNEKPSVPPNEVISQDEKEAGIWGLTEADNGKVVNGTQTFSINDNEDPLFASNEVLSQMEKETYSGSGGPTEAYNGKVNGTPTLLSIIDEDLGFDEFTLQDMPSDEDELPPMSSDSDALPPSSSEQSDSSIQSDELDPNENDECYKNLQLNGTKVESQEDETPSTPATVTKKWVRGRLIEVPEEA